MGSPNDRAVYRPVPLWPGITWGHDARCSCSWAVRDGVMQVKVKSGACLVHMTEPSLEVLLGELIAVLAEALESENRAKCGSRSGYHRHLREGTEVCPGCRMADRDYGMARKRAGRRAVREGLREAA